jgi:4-amino-4-deoxy-L-arabinose transferase-like glycosyltransferase
MKLTPASSSVFAFAAIFGFLFLLHLPLLHLPYFWDEAGYYVPAARDLLSTGSVIPHSIPSNAHPPLVMAYLAAAWKLFGYSPFVTRTAMLLVAAFALLGVFRLASRVANLQVAIAATACTALYPVFFAQSSLAQVDLAAAGLTLWGLDAYLEGHRRATAFWLSLAVLTKETAVLAPVALFAWEKVSPWFGFRIQSTSPKAADRQTTSVARSSSAWAGIFQPAGSLLTPVLVLCGWYAYHYSRTGYVFGNPEFFRYNVQATVNPLRIVLVLGMRLWQSFGYLHLWVLTLLMFWAMKRPPLHDGHHERPRIAVPVQAVFGVLVLTYIAALAIVGGAVLARYLLTIIPLVILVAVSTLWRRVRLWQLLVGIVCAAFVVALFSNPPYGFAPEDNLSYRDYVVMHQRAEAYLEAHYPQARVLTAWPASDELTRPYLGYVTQPMPVLRLENFALDEVMGAAQGAVQRDTRFDVALVFSTKYEPGYRLLGNGRAWQELKARFFGFHRDLPPEVIAQILGGRVVHAEAHKGQWVAVIEMLRAYDARGATPPSLHRNATAEGHPVSTP